MERTAVWARFRESDGSVWQIVKMDGIGTSANECGVCSFSERNVWWVVFGTGSRYKDLDVTSIAGKA
jgi:hypothetical protein